MSKPESTHNGMPTVIFKSSDYYGVMPEKPNIERIRSIFAEKISLKGDVKIGAYDFCTVLLMSQMMMILCSFKSGPPIINQRKILLLFRCGSNYQTRNGKSSKVENSKPRRDKTNQHQKQKAKQREPLKHNIDNKRNQTGGQTNKVRGTT
ncbi:hypothetical protein H5410_036931 [Solanum commersonii]|uniref:Uncharacterized protein n=1 Tax=Solanum commersonii TaxID=4109 RepID=A0A9J5Y4V9_SOLCO|nr:hypothetical protein H5410_036931 [Solanum commersonii]